MADDSYYFDYFDSADILKGVIGEIQALLDERPDVTSFNFIEIYHCFEQYEIVREHLMRVDTKFGFVPKIIDNLDNSPEFQKDVITRRYMKTLVTHSRTCLAFIERRLNGAREQVFEEQVAHANIHVSKPKEKSQEELNLFVQNLIVEFKEQVENRGSWALFWDRDVKKHIWETEVQKLFFLFASSICRSNDLDISPETNSGAGSVDFKFTSSGSIKSLVEFKMSDNSKVLDGFTKQLAAYKRAERANHASYVVIEVSNIESIKLKLHIEAENDPNADIHFIDAKCRPSASKL